MNKIIIFLGASGSGKSTLEKKMFTLFPNRFKRIVSATTRSPRSGEAHGQDYFFLSHEDFSTTPMAESDAIDSNKYGTPISELQTEQDLLLSMEPNGAKKILNYLKENMPQKKAYIVYFNIPLETRINNMEHRGDDPVKLKKRLANDDIETRWKNSNLTADLEITHLRDDLENDVLKIIGEE